MTGTPSNNLRAPGTRGAQPGPRIDTLEHTTVGRSASVSSGKLVIESAIYSRKAHADIFQIGDRSVEPKFMFVLFGGSGMDRKTYTRNQKEIPSYFRSTLERTALMGQSMLFIHICAPYDVPISRLHAEPDNAQKWKAHVLNELLQKYDSQRYFVSGFSGGAALALNGLHSDPRCFGSCVFAPDGIPKNFESPTHWQSKLRLYTAKGDLVTASLNVQQQLGTLVRQKQAERVFLNRRPHDLAHYSDFGALGNAILHASKQLPKR